MAQRDVDRIEAVYARWAQGDFATPEIFHPDVRTQWMASIPDIGESRGLEALWKSVRGWLATWEHCAIAAEAIEDNGQVIIVSFRATGVHNDSHAEVEFRGVHVWKMRDGRCDELSAFVTKDEAFEALGSSS